MKYLPIHSIKISRKLINIIRYILEDMLPPYLRDSKIFLPLMHLAFKENTAQFVDFRINLLSMTPDDYADYYAKAKSQYIMGNTDLNAACIKRLQQDAHGASIIDIGCGRGFLVNIIGKHQPNAQVIGVDIDVTDCKPEYPNVSFKKGWIENLPFEDKSIDTVVCTHVLEHILNLSDAVKELRRVAKNRLIIVVPREREYRYTFNFHVQFFPYKHSFLNRIIPPTKGYQCEQLDGDIYYVEDIPNL